MDGHTVSPLDLSWTLPVDGAVLVPYSLPGSPVIKQLMQMVTMVPGQGGQFQFASPNISMRQPTDPLGMGCWTKGRHIHNLVRHCLTYRLCLLNSCKWLWACLCPHSLSTQYLVNTFACLWDEILSQWSFNLSFNLIPLPIRRTTFCEIRSCLFFFILSVMC